jgi:hypothetical protein
MPHKRMQCIFDDHPVCAETREGEMNASQKGCERISDSLPRLRGRVREGASFQGGGLFNAHRAPHA